VKRGGQVASSEIRASYEGKSREPSEEDSERIPEGVSSLSSGEKKKKRADLTVSSGEEKRQ